MKKNESKTKSTAPKKKVRAPLPWPWALGFFVALLVMPGWAVFTLGEKIGGGALLTYLALISILTYTFYWSDKRKAQKDEWRVPEGTLHLWEGLGGWPAALLAQRFLRHKTKRASFQRVFWLVIVAHQLIAFEVISEGRIFRSLSKLISDFLAR